MGESRDEWIKKRKNGYGSQRHTRQEGVTGLHAGERERVKNFVVGNDHDEIDEIGCQGRPVSYPPFV